MIRPVSSVYDWASRPCSDISWQTAIVDYQNEATALEAQCCRDRRNWGHVSSCQFMSARTLSHVVFPDPHHARETLWFDQERTL